MNIISKIAILCVDDEKIVLDSLKIQLKKKFKNKFLIEFAEDSEEAIEVIDDLLSKEIDLLLIISDYQMPGMTGDLFVTSLKSKLPSVNILMLTGQMPEDIKSSLLLKNIVLKVISKPWDELELLDIILKLSNHE